LFRDTKGGAILQINKKDINDIEIPIPTEESMMDKITELLNTQEKLIQLRKEHLKKEEEKLKILEQSLLSGRIIC